MQRFSYIISISSPKLTHFSPSYPTTTKFLPHFDTCCGHVGDHFPPSWSATLVSTRKKNTGLFSSARIIMYYVVTYDSLEEKICSSGFVTWLLKTTCGNMSKEFKQFFWDADHRYFIIETCHCFRISKRIKRIRIKSTESALIQLIFKYTFYQR